MGYALECKNLVALQCVRRCGLRIAFVASECRRMSFLCSACAAVGYALVSLHPNAEEHVDDLAAFARKKMAARKSHGKGRNSGG